jgi:hypothetical protein
MRPIDFLRGHRVDLHACTAGENFAAHCRESRFYSIRFEYVRAERAGNRRLREHEFTLPSGLMVRISLCQLCAADANPRGWTRPARKRAQSTVNGIRDAKLLSQRICDAANGATLVGSIIAIAIISVRARRNNADKYR